MAQQVVTELVIDANTSGADQFSDSMGKAGSSAATTALQVAGLGVAVVAVLASLRSFVDYVGSTNKVLVDIGENAKLAGMSTREFQETLFAARTARLTEKDFVSGLDKIGQDLTQASRGVTDFGKLFQANGLSIRDTNGQLKTTKAALNDIATLMQGQTPQTQQAIAKIVGLSKEWVPFLKDGVDGIDEQKQAAERLGIVIDDSVIQKAKDFDRDWRVAVAAWESQFQASLATVMPLLVKAASLAMTILEAAGKAASFVQRQFTPIEDQSVGDIEKRIADVEALRAKMATLKEMSDAVNDSYARGDTAFSLDRAALEAIQIKREIQLKNQKDMLLGDDQADLAKADEVLEKLKLLLFWKKQLVDMPNINGVDAGSFSTKKTIIPNFGGDQSDAVDRAINSLRRHTEQQIADAKAVGQGAAAQAQYRAEAALTSAVQANGGQITAQQAAQFEILKQKAIAAAEALAKAKVAADIKFNRDTGFLSQEDVQIAQQLRQIYPDVATALGSVEAQGIRVNNAMRGLSSSLESSLVSGLADITTGSKSASQGFQDMSKAIIRAIEEMIIKITIIQPLMRSLQMAFGSFGGGMFGGGAAVTSGLDGLAAVHHTGGVVGEGAAMRYVHPAYFDVAPRYHSGGIVGLAPDEVPAILQRGERVIPRGQSASGGVMLNVNVINQTGVPVKTETSQDANGDMTITLKKMVEQIGVESIASGDMGRAITTKYGVKQFAGQ